MQAVANVFCLESGQRIRKPPGNMPGSWIVLKAPDMPEFVRHHQNPEKFRRERPVYTIHPEDEVTVSQSWVPGHSLATEAEMFACDDRCQQDVYGEVIYEGPLRPVKPSRAKN